MWPDLKTAGAKGDRWFQRDDVKLAIEAVREAAQDRIRAEFLESDCGLTNIIKLIATRLTNPETPAREFKDLAIYALDMQGHAPKTHKERPSSANALANTQAAIAAAAGFGAAAGARLPDGRFPAVRAVFPEDQGQAGHPAALRPLAAPSPDVGGPEVAD